jgi:hypothetical protein
MDQNLASFRLNRISEGPKISPRSRSPQAISPEPLQIISLSRNSGPSVSPNLARPRTASGPLVSARSLTTPDIVSDVRSVPLVSTGTYFMPSQRKTSLGPRPKTSLKSALKLDSQRDLSSPPQDSLPTPRLITDPAPPNTDRPLGTGSIHMFRRILTNMRQFEDTPIDDYGMLSPNIFNV